MKKWLDYMKIIDDISKMDKKELLNRYWLDKLNDNLYMIDYLLDSFYELELKNVKCFYDVENDFITINWDRILYKYQNWNHKDDFIYFFRWLVYWLYNL